MARVVVTGATGFVGSALVPELINAGHEVISLERQKRQNKPVGVKCVMVENWNKDTLTPLMQGAQIVLHLASRNHHVGDDAEKSAELYRAQIYELSLAVAEAAEAADIDLLVYLSTIKVRELETRPQSSNLALQQPYGFYKQQTELALQNMAQTNPAGLKVAILRPPLIYALSAKANFGTMVKLVKSGLPLPVPATGAQRSLISRDNLVACLVQIIKKQSDLPRGCNTMEVCDGKTYSISEQLSGIAVAMNRRIRLIKLPRWILKMTFKTLGKGALLENIETEMVLSNEQVTAYCGWLPEHSWLAK